MKKTFLWSLILAGTSFMYAGCSKEPLKDLTTEESRIYITDHDSSIIFSDYKTYSIADSVAIIQNGQATHQLDNSDAAYIDAVKKYMTASGFTLVAKDQNPDLGVNVNHIINTSTGVISYGDYWDDYGGYWDPYYWGYGGYGYYVPYAYSVYQINEGAISTDILDLKDAATKNKIDVVWTGLIRGPEIFNANVADSQVKALFDQSPYLKTN
ncbi:MAG: DUF4136 domain-containing protein [Ginsengibacter sp.]